MARLTINGFDEYSAMLSKLTKSTETIAQKAVEAGANVVLDGIKMRLRGVLSGKSTGDLEKSYGISPMRKDGYGDYDVRVGPHAYDRKGTANRLKARVLEKRKPFMRSAQIATRKTAQAAMARVIEEETQKITK